MKISGGGGEEEDIEREEEEEEEVTRGNLQVSEGRSCSAAVDSGLGAAAECLLVSSIFVAQQWALRPGGVVLW